MLASAVDAPVICTIDTVVAIQRRVRAGPAITGIGGAGIAVVTVATVLARIYFKCVNPDVVVTCVIDFDRTNGSA